MTELRAKIIEEVIRQFNERGMKFTMDDIAAKLHISKKTIYKEFKDKNELFTETVNHGLAALKEKEAQIIADESLDIVEKLSRLIVCLPDKYKHIDFRRVYQLKESFPEVHSLIIGRLERDWEEAKSLIEEAKEKGLIRDLPVPLVRLMVDGTVEKFLGSTDLMRAGISYEESLDIMMDIIMNGIRVKK